MGFFSWIRSQVTAAVLGGFADAAEALGQTHDPAEAAQQLRDRLALPAPAPGGVEAPEGNGRRRKVAP